MDSWIYWLWTEFSAQPVAWIGLVISLSLAGLRGYEFIRDRQRIKFKLVTSYVHTTLWTHQDIGTALHAMGVTSGSTVQAQVVVRPGDCRKRFEVLEFTLQNRYKHEITLGRLRLNNWIRAEKYAPHMYDQKRDYRVFDLYSREKMNLEDFVVLSPGQVIGFRIESFKQPNSDSPTFTSNHLFAAVDNPKSYPLEFVSDMGPRKFQIKLNEPVPNPISYDLEYRWSTDIDGLGPMQKAIRFEYPQGEPEKQRDSYPRITRMKYYWSDRIYRLRAWWRSQLNRRRSKG